MEIDASNRFKLYRQTSQHFNQTFNTICQQTLFDATCYAATGQVRRYKYTPDADIDGFTALYHFGQIERVSIDGAARPTECQKGTFSAQVHEFTGAVNYAWSRGEITASGNTNWVSIARTARFSEVEDCLGGRPRPPTAAVHLASRRQIRRRS